MTEKRFIQVWFDLDNQNGCWNCKNDWSICRVNNIGSVGYIRGISHCALKDWEYDKEKHKNSKSKYSWYKQYKELLNENEQLKSELQHIYQIATIKKVEEIVEKVYDDLLYESSEESDYARKKIIKCLEDIGEFYDEVE